MTTDDLEFQISQYVDGTLSDDERAALEAILKQDATAHAVLVEHRRVTDALRASRLMPEVDYVALAARVSDVLDAEEARVEQAYRIPARSSSLKWLRWGAPVALAASVLIGFAVVSKTSTPVAPLTPTVGPMVNNLTPAMPGVLEVTGPQVPKPDGDAIANITVGPAPGADPSNAPAVAQVVPGTGPRVIYLSESRPTTNTPATQPVDKPLY